MWAIIIFIGSLTPGHSVSNVGLIDFLAHKAVHMLEYTLFLILLYRGTKKFWPALLILTLYAITDEIHQGFTPGREPRVTDVIIDVVASSTGAFILWKLLPILPRRPRIWAQNWLGL